MMACQNTIMPLLLDLLLLPEVSLSGCPGNEDGEGQMLTVVTGRLKFRSSSYRLVAGRVQMARGYTRVGLADWN